MRKTIRKALAAVVTASQLISSLTAPVSAGSSGSLAVSFTSFEDFIDFITDVASQYPEGTDPDIIFFDILDQLFADQDFDWRAEWDAHNPYPMYRLYNPNSGEHFYTADEEEQANVVAAGWNDEGIGWWAPLTLNRLVYRLYNANGGEHHYTLDPDERDMLIAHGWRYEGVGWSSADETGIPVYREYNPNQFSCNHNFTTDKAEHDYLVSIGWKDEGIAWYAAEPKAE